MKYKNITLSIFAIYSLLSIYGCRPKDELSMVNIIVTPNNAYFEVNSDAILIFQVKAFSNDDIVKRVVIQSVDGKANKTNLLDTIINQKQTIFDYVYRPQLYETDMEMSLKFTAYSSLDESTTTTLLGKVIKIDKHLDEYAGFTLYAADSKKESGFNIEQLKILFVSTATEAEVDIYDYADTLSTEVNRFEREWRSFTSVSFVKYNGFDYSSATDKSIKDAYNVGVKQPICQNICNNDIIIIGRDKEAIGVIKVVNVYDNKDISNDRYIFNIKPIKQKP